MKLARFLVGLLLAGLILISGCVEKECETGTDCLAKECFTSECVDNKCSYSPVPDCCGNKICEPGETYESCYQDCPNCDDKNDCTIDEFDFHEQKCVNTPSFSPCCGDGKCDEGRETDLNCSKDCPDCDDNDKNTGEYFNYETQKCGYIRYAFFEDFEDSEIGLDLFEERWTIENDNGNKVLNGYGIDHANAYIKNKEFNDFVFESKIKILNGNPQLSFRASGNGEYYIRIDIEGISLTKEKPMGTFFDSGRSGFHIGNTWHTYRISCFGKNVKVYIDDELKIDYYDDDPILSGDIKLEVEKGSHVYFDDLKIKES